MPTEEIAPGVHWIRLGRVNCYLVTNPAGASLVDCGLPLHFSALIGILSEHGLDGAGGLKRILLTHRHLDHVGSVAALAERTGAAVLAHALDAPAVAGRERLSPTAGGSVGARLLGRLVAFSDRRVFRYRPWTQVEAIEEGWRGDGLEALHLPGHTPGQTGYLVEQAGVVICGDAAVHEGGGVLVPPSARFTLAPAASRRSMARLAELDAELFCFGHGRPLPASAARPALGRLARA